MEYVTRPEPDSEKEKALTLALERLLGGDVLPAVYRSRWRAAGIAENVDDEPECASERGSDGV